MLCRKSPSADCFTILLAGCIAVAVCGLARAADNSKPEAASSKRPELPLEKVVMFSSGVGFFEHRGNVQGDSQVELKFNVEDINDLLKSMVLEDRGGGRVSTISYGSKDPITKTLQTFAINLTENPTLGQILNQVRGERVEVDAPNAIAGIVLGVENRKKEIGKDHEPVEVEMLNLLTDAGLRSVPLESVGHVKLANEKLDAELRQALAVLAMGHSTDKKTVTLNFLGQGSRPVRVGYIQQTPIWKTSYRLVLKEDESPFLQGWAIVENTTEEDWNKVNLTLVSGRPISFVMDLYQPLYVKRPVVEPELYASLRPQTYDQDLAKKEEALRELGRTADTAAAPPMAPAQAAAGAAGGGFGERFRGAGINGSLAAGEKPAESESYAFNVGKIGKTAAQAADVGELFQYVIEMPVTLSRRQSAMLPIVNEPVKGEKVSIYNQAVQAKHPLNGLKLTNSTDLHLMQGPITVFDGGAYAGDARIEDLSPGGQRLLSYAMDLDTEVAPETIGHPDQLLTVTLKKGVMHVSHKLQRTQKYVVKNSGKKSKNVLIEYPAEADWTLVAPEKPAEKTRGMYRFAMQAEPGKPADLKIELERVGRQELVLTNLDDNTILFYSNQKVVGEKVKQALKEVVQRKQKLQKLGEQRVQKEQQITTISQEQERIRQNMTQLDRKNDLYSRYVKKFSDQEDQVEKLREQIRSISEDESQQRKSLDDFLVGLDLS